MQMRLWDIRTYHCLHVFDQHQTQKHGRKRPRGAVDTAADLQANTAQARARAHAGTITCVQPTEDGLHWVSAGTDSRMRLWDTRWHRNLLVNYPSAFNRSLKVSVLLNPVTSYTHTISPDHNAGAHTIQTQKTIAACLAALHQRQIRLACFHMHADLT